MQKKFWQIGTEQASAMAGLLGVEKGIEQAAEGLNRYHTDQVRIGFSGGKDSTALALLYLYLVESEKVPGPENCEMICVDTTYELPPLIENAHAVADLLDRRAGWKTQFILPDFESRFLFQLLGRGLFTPGMNGRNRWCTRMMKAEPINAIKKDHFLYLYGSRMDESRSRSASIQNSCSLAGSECGVGVYMENENGVSYSPITNWRNCAVWDWLAMSRRLVGFDASLLVNLYGAYDADAMGISDLTAAQISEIVDSTTRTGCMGCPVVGHDYALDRICEWPKWSHLVPYKKLRPLYVELRQHKHRLRKPPGERKVNGYFKKQQSRVGPICIESRLWALDEILEMQSQSMAIAEKKGLPPVLVVCEKMEKLIRDAIGNNEFPNGWTGKEPLATDPKAKQADYAGKDTIQDHLF